MTRDMELTCNDEWWDADGQTHLVGCWDGQSRDILITETETKTDTEKILKTETI